ncbi:amino acid ABC transporter ATP-binding protein [Arthrobacter mobilis]|uniref:Arginine transport ATP-binding protein ArtP n=1 Tax=Arthrobacter mobilis TaxID=2724944 RepID=A0A7X6HE75_9MICC|nr:amino acid ABC transporter ATP-binding protein [Arthrobacter mobilis]NKX55421.1 amino acid ABC transporter ATP-binding protein [Arthrobacter mobilis]
MTTSNPLTPEQETATPAVELDGIRLRYGNHLALKDVSLELAAGEVMAMIGPSGSGKSSLLRCINLLERPESGILRVFGQSVPLEREIAAKELAQLRRKVGMVFQSFNLFPHLPVLRNITLPQERVLKRSRDEAEARARELLERVGLGDKADAYPGKLSGGQQQRVAIARALAMDPRVLLFDEPTSALDPELGIEVLAVMRDLAETGVTMMVVTHEIHFAADVADRIVVMADGQILEQGDPDQVLTDPQTERTQRFLRAVKDR